MGSASTPLAVHFSMNSRASASSPAYTRMLIVTCAHSALPKTSTHATLPTGPSHTNHRHLYEDIISCNVRRRSSTKTGALLPWLVDCGRCSKATFCHQK